MPHLMLEYTDNLAGAFNPRLTLFRLHQSLTNAGLCEKDELKSRAVKLKDYLIGDGSNEQGFVHLHFAQRATHDPEQKERVVEELHKQLCACIGTPPIPIQITTEAVDLVPERFSYLKTVRSPDSD